MFKMSCESPSRPLGVVNSNALEILSPSLQSCKRRKSALGDAVRLVVPITPSKCTVPMVEDKENCENVTQPSILVKTPNKDVTNARQTFTPGKSVVHSSEQQEPDDVDDTDRSWHVDDFALGKPLGKGKFGNVYLAKQKKSQAQIALKVLFKAQMTSRQTIKMLKREVEIQYRLSHENITKLYG